MNSSYYFLFTVLELILKHFSQSLLTAAMIKCSFRFVSILANPFTSPSIIIPHSTGDTGMNPPFPSPLKSWLYDAS